MRVSIKNEMFQVLNKKIVADGILTTALVEMCVATSRHLLKENRYRKKLIIDVLCALVDVDVSIIILTIQKII